MMEVPISWIGITNSSFSRFARLTQIPRLFPNMYLLIFVKGVDKSNSAVTLASPDGQITALDFFGVENVLGCQSSRNQSGLPVSAGLCE